MLIILNSNVLHSVNGADGVLVKKIDIFSIVCLHLLSQDLLLLISHFPLSSVLYILSFTFPPCLQHDFVWLWKRGEKEE